MGTDTSWTFGHGIPGKLAVFEFPDAARYTDLQTAVAAWDLPAAMAAVAAGGDLGLPTPDGFTVLHLACATGAGPDGPEDAMLEWVLRVLGSRLLGLVDTRGPVGCPGGGTALGMALHFRVASRVAKLLAAGASPVPEVHAAARANNLQWFHAVVGVLHVEDPVLCDPFTGNTTLHMAAGATSGGDPYNPHTRQALGGLWDSSSPEFRLGHGYPSWGLYVYRPTDTNAEQIEEAPVTDAAAAPGFFPEVLLWLLARVQGREEVLEAVNVHKDTAMHVAAASGQAANLAACLAFCLAVGPVNEAGSTPLLAALAAGNLASVRCMQLMGFKCGFEVQMRHALVNFGDHPRRSAQCVLQVLRANQSKKSVASVADLEISGIDCIGFVANRGWVIALDLLLCVMRMSTTTALHAVYAVFESGNMDCVRRVLKYPRLDMKAVLKYAAFSMKTAATDFVVYLCEILGCPVPGIVNTSAISRLMEKVNELAEKMHDEVQVLVNGNDSLETRAGIQPLGALWKDRVDTMKRMYATVKFTTKVWQETDCEGLRRGWRTLLCATVEMSEGVPYDDQRNLDITEPVVHNHGLFQAAAAREAECAAVWKTGRPFPVPWVLDPEFAGSTDDVDTGPNPRTANPEYHPFLLDGTNVLSHMPNRLAAHVLQAVGGVQHGAAPGSGAGASAGAGAGAGAVVDEDDDEDDDDYEDYNHHEDYDEDFDGFYDSYGDDGE